MLKLMVGVLMGIILGFVATNIDQYNQIKRGYVYNLFIDGEKVIKVIPIVKNDTKIKRRINEKIFKYY